MGNCLKKCALNNCHYYWQMSSVSSIVTSSGDEETEYEPELMYTPLELPWNENYWNIQITHAVTPNEGLYFEHILICVINCYRLFLWGNWKCSVGNVNGKYGKPTCEQFFVKNCDIYLLFLSYVEHVKSRGAPYVDINIDCGQSNHYR